MDINENLDLKNMIDKLIEYNKEIDEEIECLKLAQKSSEKIIKSYILNCGDRYITEDDVLFYESKFFNVKLEELKEENKHKSERLEADRYKIIIIDKNN